MQSCFYSQLLALMQDNAATPDKQSYEEALLDFATVTHEVSDHTDLDVSLQLNRQLHAALRRKQEEISALKETNDQLRHLAKQTEHYASMLDALTTGFQRETVSQCTAERPREDHSSEDSWTSLLTQEGSSDPSSRALTNSITTDTQNPISGGNQYLWSTWNDLLCEDAEDTSLNCPSGSKHPRFDDELVQLELENLKAQLDQDPLVSQELRDDSPLTPDQNLEMSTDRLNIFGAFHGFQVVIETSPIKSDLKTNSDYGRVVCFKTAIRDHSTVKTKVFPHGKAFTTLTPSGSCKFLWVPNDN